MTYRSTICGVPDDGFTSAELGTESGDLVGRVFELDSGWYVECQDLDYLQEPQFLKAILEARDDLRHYVNRKGPVPEGATRAAASLWLMQRDDGKGFTIPSD